MKDKADSLPEDALIDRYEIKKTLGGGGFSFVYLAKNKDTQEDVVIKEYFPSRLARRNEAGQIVATEPRKEKLFNMGRKLFFSEVSILASLQHSNIIKILGLFHAHGTIYSVMPYEKGLTLQQYIRRQTHPIREHRILEFFTPILSALQFMHDQQMLHLDIKPGNIYLCSTGQPLLLDFGAVHKVLRSEEPRLFPVVSQGFSPPEQSSKKGILGPSTDLYAIGATMRTCMERKPPPASKLLVSGKEKMMPAVKAYKGKYSPWLLELVDYCMELDPKNRPQSAAEVLEQLNKHGLAA